MNRKISEVMTQDVQVVAPDSTIQEVAQKMKDVDIGLVPVCDDENLIGMISDRDIVTRVVAAGRDPRQVAAQDVMTSPIIFCFEDQEIDEAARIMEAKQVRRLVVVNREKKLLGILSIGDIAVKAGREELVGEIIEKVSEPLRGRGAA